MAGEARLESRRGVASIPVPLTATPAADGCVRVDSRPGAPLGTVILFERRGDRTGIEIRSQAGVSGGSTSGWSNSDFIVRL